MEELLELLSQIQELAGAGIEALTGAEEAAYEEAPAEGEEASAEGEVPPEEEAF